MARGSAIMKVGPWGAKRGTSKDISSSSNPARLKSITVSHSSVPRGRIYAFSFVYIDQKGTPISIGPWGSSACGCAGLEEKIDILTGDYVNHLSGTTDSEGVTSLNIVTSKGSEYQFGCPSGSTFSVPLNEINGGEVISFFGISGANSLAALGVYVTGEKQVVKMGAWGQPQGRTTDINLKNLPRHLLSVTIYNSDRVNGFSFVYLDQNGQTIDVPTCGSDKGQPNQFNMAQGEFVNCVSGTTDDYGVTSLTFSTTKGGQYGPYGSPDESTNWFSVPLQQGTGAALSFFGRSAGNYIAAFGTYVGARTG